MQAARCFCFVIFKATKALITGIQYVPGVGGRSRKAPGSAGSSVGFGEPGDAFGSRLMEVSVSGLRGDSEQLCSYSSQPLM